MSDNLKLKLQPEEAVVEKTGDDVESIFRTEDDNVERETQTAKLEDTEECTELAEPEVVVRSGKKKAQNKNVDVWDDSALIEAWESAVREYQEYHSPIASKAEKKTNPTPQRTPSTKSTQNNSAVTNPSTTPQPKAAVSGKEQVKQNTSTALPGSPAASTPLKSQVEKEASKSTTHDQNVPQHDATGYPYPYTYPHPYPPISSWGCDPNYACYYSQHGYAYPQTQSPNQNTAEDTAANAAPPTLPLVAQASEMKSDPPFGPVPNLAGIDDKNLSNVIMAWYFAGYYTGLYQASKKWPQINDSELSL